MLTTFSKQKGLALLFTSVALLLIASTVTLYTINTTLNEQKVLAKNYQVEQAFEAAEAGLEFGLAYLKQNSTTIMVNRGSNKIDGFTFSSGAISALPNGATYTITYTSPTASDYTLVKVTATGTSSDGTTIRQVSQLVKKKSLLSAPVTWPLTVQGNVNLSGSVNVVNNSYNQTIHSGGTTTLSGATTASGSSTTSNSSNIRSDVNRNDTTLAAMSDDTFFSSFFGTTKAAIKSQATNVYTSASSNNYSSSLGGLTKRLIWIDQSSGTASINGSTTIGSTAEPVIMIINLANGADLKINGNVNIYGLVYVITGDGSWDNTSGGGSTLRGNVIVEGSYSSTGNPDLIYDPTVTSNLNNFGVFTKVPGSWQDI